MHFHFLKTESKYKGGEEQTRESLVTIMCLSR